MRRGLERVGTGFAVLAILALALRLSIRDRVPVLATLFYASPLPVVAMLLFACAAGWWRRRSVAPLLCGAVLLAFSAWPFVRAPHTGEEPTVRLVLWNVAHRGDATRTRDAMATMDADIAVLVETGKVSRGALEAWAWPAELSTDGMLVLSRGAIVDEGPLAVGKNALARRFSVTTEGGTSVPIVVMDVRSDPLVPRLPSLRSLLGHVDSIEGPLVLLGDFNTPPESAGFDGFRASFTHAFESAGAGWEPTWPSPVPVLHLDHVWTRGVTTVHAEHRWVRGFDHRAVVVELAPAARP